MGFSDAVIIFETKIKILLIHHYPFFKDIEKSKQTKTKIETSDACFG
jgi:hypothetical protein